jgi:sugar phosphate isomerase/epimerase
MTRINANADNPDAFSPHCIIRSVIRFINPFSFASIRVIRGKLPYPANLPMLSRTLALAFVLTATAFAAPAVNPFFAMDNIARGGPDTVPAMLSELGYDGYGGRVPDEIMAPAITAKGLKFFNGYHVIDLNPAQPAPNEKLRAWLAAMSKYDTTLWLGINKVTRADGTPYAVSSTEADEFVLSQIRAIAEAAAAQHVRVALYPHTGFWMARVDDAQRLADKINRPDVGLTFNLCHWLKVEGSERDPLPVLRTALPRLMFVSISGADTGDTRIYGWERLIQPLDAGTYDLEKFVRQLRALGYQGPVGFQGYNIKGDPREVLARSIAAWRKFTAAP